jgi:hypothetical protein
MILRGKADLPLLGTRLSLCSPPAADVDRLGFCVTDSIRNLSRLTASHDIVRLHAKKYGSKRVQQGLFGQCRLEFWLPNRREMSNVAPAMVLSWTPHFATSWMARSVERLPSERYPRWTRTFSRYSPPIDASRTPEQFRTILLAAAAAFEPEPEESSFPPALPKYCLQACAYRPLPTHTPCLFWRRDQDHGVRLHGNRYRTVHGFSRLRVIFQFTIATILCDFAR